MNAIDIGSWYAYLFYNPVKGTLEIYRYERNRETKNSKKFQIERTQMKMAPIFGWHARMRAQVLTPRRIQIGTWFLKVARTKELSSTDT